ncbi:MAG: hypothetical protein Kapaf2KO_20430 [Candidatus Kapaibacteriales bacterium]
MKKLLLIMLTAAFPLSVLHAENEGPQPLGSSDPDNFVKAGAAGAGFLKIGIGARGTAMAGATGALVDDLSAIHWNPAGVAQVQGVSVFGSVSPYFADFNHNFVAASVGISEDFVLAAHANSFGATGIPITTLVDDQGTGATYDINDLSVGLTFAGYLTDQFAFGITGKYARTAFAAVGAGVVSFDVGTQYDTGLYGLQIGFSIHNLGGQTQFEGEDLASTYTALSTASQAPVDIQLASFPFSMPLTFRAGIGGDIYDQDEHLLRAEFDFITYSDSPEQAAIGAEYVWNDILAARAGYLFNNDQFGLSWGAGFIYKTGDFDGSIDYGMDLTANLGLVHRINLNIQLDD